MESCRYTLTLDAFIPRDVLARLTEPFHPQAWEVIGDHITYTTVREVGDGLHLVEEFTDRLALWEFRTAFTLVECGTPHSEGSVYRYAPAFGTHVQPWHHDAAWVPAEALARAVDRFAGDELVAHLRGTILGEAWADACPPIPAEA